MVSVRTSLALANEKQTAPHDYRRQGPSLLADRFWSTPLRASTITIPLAETPLSNDAHRHARELCKILPAGRAHEQITRELRELGEESTPANTPTRTQLHRKRVYQNRRHFPTSDAIQNINLMHGPTGFLENSSYPVVRIILASQAGLKLLRQHGTNIYIDTTFKLIEQDLKLTVTLYSHI